MEDNPKPAAGAPAAPPRTKTKKRSLIHIFKVASYLLRRPSPKSKSSKGTWKKLLGSIRLMHLHSSESPPPAIEHKAKPVAVESESKERPLRLRPAEYLSSRSVSSVSGSSRYQSAENLRELVEPEEEEEEECWYDDGDRMIDSKAEQFISMFYERMKLENMEQQETDVGK